MSRIDEKCRTLLGHAPSPPQLGQRSDNRIAELSAHIEAATYQLLCLIREFDDRQGWVAEGARSCAHWLSWRIGIGLNAARERVRVARALVDLPLISRSLMLASEDKDITAENIKTALESFQAQPMGGLTAPLTYTSDDRRPSNRARIYTINKSGKLTFLEQVGITLKPEWLGW